MASAVFPEKRTRSQLALPDDLLLQLSQGSPLKDARTALRHSHTSMEAGTTDRAEIVQEIDDEFLPPGKSIPVSRMAKRSVSPSPRDEYAFKPQSPSDGRELKRTKLDDNEVLASNRLPFSTTTHVLPSRPAHTRSQSQPTYSESSICARSGTTSADASSTNVCGENESAEGRARSVPLFPSSLPSGIVHIDLRNPPASPRRQKSRSPSKERELRIVPGLAATVKLDTIQDEADSAMNDEQVFHSIPQPITCDNKDPVVDVLPIENESTSGTVLAGSPITPPTSSKKRLTPLVLPVVVEPPATPMRESSPLSPLTPISDTPFPSNSASEDIRYPASGSGINLAPVSPSKPSLGLATITKSRLPRPSSSTNLALSAKKSPQPIKRPVASSSSGSVTTGPRVSNAFTVLMANARESKEQVKGKGKGKATVSKTTYSSYNGPKTAIGPSTPPRKGKTLETSTPKTSLKSKMKPKIPQKPKPKPALPVLPSLPPEVENEEPTPPQSSFFPRSPSPAHSTHSIRPTAPLVQDVSMESIVSVVDPDVPMKDDFSVPTQPSHPGQTKGALTIEGPPAGLVELGLLIAPDAPVELPGSEPHVSVPEDIVNLPPTEDVDPVADAGIATPISQAGPSKSVEPTPVDRPTDPPPAKSTSTKVHISKRKPSSIPAPTRITRSVSLKRNQKVSEVPKALPTKATGKQVLPKKKSPTSVSSNVVSGSSSKSTDEVPPETVQSTSHLPGHPTESVGTLLPPRSPMKLDSVIDTVKQNAITRKSSFAQPTISALTKRVSPKKLSLLKPRGPSPNKLARSVSMLSRPRASLSRSFTSYSNLEGSSLSTLSSALEKLQQRPPERPNTSMGFNREDPDSSIEVEATSKDDSSIRPSGPDHSKTVSSSEGEAGKSRLVQRTLFNGPRSSLAGKFMVGSLSSGSQTRATGGFKVPAQPSKTGPRILGVGSGIFSGAMRARTMHKASRKTSLPSVMASPVKGGNAKAAMDITENDVPQNDAQDSHVPPSDTPADSMPLLDVEGKGKERATEPCNSDLSHGVSLAPRALSESPNVSSTTGLGLMGPPATPKGRRALRSISSTYPSTSSSAEASGRVSPTRTSLRLAEKTSDYGVSESNMISAVSTTSQPESLAFLKDCVIFVDVRNDDGDDVGSLFIEMLEGMGARILTRVGQTCTHVVFKNGLMSTINRYRLLRDPKPFVVGIAWVVECVEQKKHIDEARFLVDLDGVNFSGTSKRRRSMLPKLISHDFEERRGSSDIEGDVSMDGSTSSMTLDDDLTPLEKARRRVVAR